MQHGFISADVLPATRPSGECTEGNSTRRNHRSVLVLLSSTQGTLLPLCRLHNANTTASITHDHYSSMQEVMLLYIFVTFSSQIYNIEYYCDHCFNSRFLGELGLGGFSVWYYSICSRRIPLGLRDRVAQAFMGWIPFLTLK